LTCQDRVTTPPLARMHRRRRSARPAHGIAPGPRVSAAPPALPPSARRSGAVLRASCPRRACARAPRCPAGPTPKATPAAACLRPMPVPSCRSRHGAPRQRTRARAPEKGECHMAHRARQRRGQLLRMPGQQNAAPAQHGARRHGRVEEFGPVPHAGAKCKGDRRRRARQKSTRSAGSPADAPPSKRGKPARRSCGGRSASGAAFRGAATLTKTPRHRSRLQTHRPYARLCKLGTIASPGHCVPTCYVVFRVCKRAREFCKLGFRMLKLDTAARRLIVSPLVS